MTGLLTFLGGDDFIAAVMSARCLHLRGRVGSGKTSLAVALSYEMLSRGYVDYCVSTAPVAWAIPFEECPPFKFVAILDEVGVEFDSRRAGNRKQNEFRLAATAFLRKAGIYLICPSKVAPDGSFRSLTVERAWGLGPLDCYVWAAEDGAHAEKEKFFVWGRSRLWRHKYHGTTRSLYSSLAGPGDFEPCADLLRRTSAQFKAGGPYSSFDWHFASGRHHRTLEISASPSAISELALAATSSRERAQRRASDLADKARLERDDSNGDRPSMARARVSGTEAEGELLTLQPNDITGSLGNYRS